MAVQHTSAYHTDASRSGVLVNRLWTALAGLVCLALFLSTFQVTINGSDQPYATDVGEIQNALPRWGLIHRSGYPLYTFTGSLFVTSLRLLGVEPAAGASLVSVLWGVVSIALLAALAQELGVLGPASALGGVALAVSTSIWAYASIAEVHTMTLALTVATLLLATRFGRTGTRRDLLLLTIAFTQGVAHQRSVSLLAPAVAVLIWPHLRTVWHERVPALILAALAPLTYLYMPFRVWTGANWVFGSPGTWDGFWEMVLDNRAGRVVQWTGSMPLWRERIGTSLQLLADDMAWPLLIAGVLGIATWTLATRRWREGLGLALSWVPNLVLTVLIWRGRVIDAQLAAKLPVVAVVCLGLALALNVLRRWRRWVGVGAQAILVLILVAWGWTTRLFVLSMTRDASAEKVIAKAAQIAPPPPEWNGRQTTLVVPWGNTYWALAYAQACRGELPGLNLVDHNAAPRAIVERGDRLMVLDETLCVFPLSWWENLLGRLHLRGVAPGVIELMQMREVEGAEVPSRMSFDLGNGLRIRSTELTWLENDSLLLLVYWEAAENPEEDYSVAVHLTAIDPPRRAGDVLAQADALHPVGGWYPTSRWEAGEIVQDTYKIRVPAGARPASVRIAMYRRTAAGDFQSSRWLSLPIPEC